MKLKTKILLILFAISLFALVIYRTYAEYINKKIKRETIECEIELFDGDHFKGDSVVIKGVGKYNSLKDLPNSDGKDWTNEADSVKVKDGTTLTTWTEKEFEGESTIYEVGEYSSIDEPFSLEIECIK